MLDWAASAINGECKIILRLVAQLDCDHSLFAFELTCQLRRRPHMHYIDGRFDTQSNLAENNPREDLDLVAPEGLHMGSEQS